METATTTGPLTVARLARAPTYGVAALLLGALIDWLTDRIAEMGYAR